MYTQSAKVTAYEGTIETLRIEIKANRGTRKNLRLYTKTGNRQGRFNPFPTLQPPPYAQGKRKSNSPHAKAKEKKKIKSASSLFTDVIFWKSAESVSKQK